MKNGLAGTLARDLELLNGAGTVAGMSDAELLCRFCLRQGDASELAFTALVARHGPMVWDVCRQILREPNDADDAFQATFLVLVRKAHSLRFTESLGPWLYGVACRVAVKARANVGKLRRREQLCIKALEYVPEKEYRDLGSADSASILFEELGRLPIKYRDPIVLCHLEGLTHEAAAAQLRWPVGTVSGRLSRARALLRGRLTRRGLSSLVAVAALDARPASAVPPKLLDAVTSLSCAQSVGRPIQTAVLALSQGVLHTMRIKKILISLFIASAAGLVTLGTGYVVGQGGPPAPDAVRPARDGPPQEKTPPALGPAITIPGGYLICNYAPIPGFPKLSAARKSAWEEMKRTRSDLKGTPEVPFMRDTRTTIETERYIAVLSPDGSSLSALNTDGGDWETYTMPPGVNGLPIEGTNVIAMALAGHAVRELAIFSGRWHIQTLREPISGEFVPQVYDTIILYVAGTDLYVFNTQAKKWYALHLTGNEEPDLRFQKDSLIVQRGDMLYVFRPKLGEWSKGVRAMRPKVAEKP